MNKKFLILMLLVTSCLVAQRTSEIGVSGGYVTNGLGAILVYDNGFGEKGSISAQFALSFADTIKDGFSIPYDTYSFNVGYFYSIYNDRFQRSSLDLGLGLKAAYQNINNGDETLYNGALITSESGLAYGLFAGAIFDYKITESIGAFVMIQESYLINSDIGNFSLYTGLGIKYLIF